MATPLYIWHIKSTERNTVGVYDSAVVVAESEKHARQTIPYGWPFRSPIPKEITVKLIGLARYNVPPGIICNTLEYVEETA